ncbi:MAG: hypothetical protein LLF89_09205 [Spirochaetaceae bacterium]|nr:hypothetical protein [Spirochaetaceae bacterium]
MPKYRGGKITSPAQANLVEIKWNESDKFDRRAADDAMKGDPVKLKKEGSGSFTLCSGSYSKLYNHTMIVQVPDVSVSNGVETITTRTFTFDKVTTNTGVSANNDGGESSRDVSFDFGEVVES